jgi:prepilin-type N-terminal cleavage/methylation domain-containing protein
MSAQKSDDRQVWDGGFTLLEVLVAVAILAIGLLTILSLHNQSIKANSEINEQTDSAMAGRVYLNYALVKSQYDGFELYFYQEGKSYTIEELYPEFKFLLDEEQQLIGNVQITKDYVSVLNARDDSEYLKLESLR